MRSVTKYRAEPRSHPRIPVSVALRAGAQERPDQILAVELALIGLSQTLVDVW